jgi:hypothetical protein
VADEMLGEKTVEQYTAYTSCYKKEPFSSCTHKYGESCGATDEKEEQFVGVGGPAQCVL